VRLLTRHIIFSTLVTQMKRRRFYMFFLDNWKCNILKREVYKFFLEIMLVSRENKVQLFSVIELFNCYAVFMASVCWSYSFSLFVIAKESPFIFKCLFVYSIVCIFLHNIQKKEDDHFFLSGEFSPSQIPQIIS
jgi:hypothetical protein